MLQFEKNGRFVTSSNDLRSVKFHALDILWRMWFEYVLISPARSHMHFIIVFSLFMTMAWVP
jgi:hypothetical protein